MADERQKYNEQFLTADMLRWALYGANDHVRRPPNQPSVRYEFLNFEMLPPEGNVYPVALYTNWSGAPRNVAVCKRTYYEYTQLWRRYCRLIDPSLYLQAVNWFLMDNKFWVKGVGLTSYPEQPPFPKCPLRKDFSLFPDWKNRQAQIWSFFKQNHFSLDFLSCQIVRAFLYTDLPMSEVLKMDAYGSNDLLPAQYHDKVQPYEGQIVSDLKTAFAKSDLAKNRDIEVAEEATEDLRSEKPAASASINVTVVKEQGRRQRDPRFSLGDAGTLPVIRSSNLSMNYNFSDFHGVRLLDDSISW